MLQKTIVAKPEEFRTRVPSRFPAILHKEQKIQAPVMENSKIPFVSRIKPPQTMLPMPKPSARVLQPTEQNKALEDPIKFPARRLLSRRSKSFSDLRSNFKTADSFKKPGTTKFPPSKPVFKSTSTFNLNEVKKPLLKHGLKSIPETSKGGPIVAAKSAIKRPATAGCDEAVKPKVSKPPKIPPYDYKARFNFLNEKHTILVQTYKDTKQRLLDVEQDLESYDVLKNDNLKLQGDYDAVFEEKSRLEVENLKVSVEVEDLKNKLEHLTKANEQLQENLETLKTKNLELLNSVSDVQEANVQLTNELEYLKTDHTNLEKRYSSLKYEHDAIKIEHECSRSVNNQLEIDLVQARSKIKTLENDLYEYKTSVQSSEELRRVMHNQIQDLKGTIRVFCRVRPNKPQEQDKMLCNISCLDEATMEIKKSKESISCISGKANDLRLQFTFDKVFPPEASQAEVFEELSQLIQSALDGYHICVFAYGQTGSGKTYTMLGEDDDQCSGMIPRTVRLIFNLITNLQKIGWTYKVEASFLEIYNEIVRDLLDPSNKDNHDIRFNEGKGTTVTNLTIKPVQSALELIQLMGVANNNRAIATTNYNEHSSRSHAVTKLTLTGFNEEMGFSYVGTLSLVDLAGSESAKTSSAERITETKNINKSLSTLGTVMSALHNKESHIPYRNSKLTYLLQSCLGGNSKTLMFVNIAPFEECYGESVNALRFASKVKEVKIGSKRNKMYLQRELSNVS